MSAKYRDTTFALLDVGQQFFLRSSVNPAVVLSTPYRKVSDAAYSIGTRSFRHLAAKDMAVVVVEVTQ